MATKTHTAPKTSSVASNGKPGLRKPQIRILQCLAKAKTALPWSEIWEKAQVDRAWVTSFVGSRDNAIRKANDLRRGYPCLLTLGYVKYGTPENEDSKVACYTITPAGRKALEKVQ